MMSFLKHLFLPQESNNHKARILHHTSFLSVILVLLIANFFLIAFEKSRPDILGISTDIKIEQLLEKTNQKRVELGLAPLTINSQLSQAAQKKAEDMFAQNYWAHNGPNGTTPWGFIKSAGYEYVYAGENLARGFSSADDVVTAWMNSPSHRENLLSSNYKDVGFAIATGSLTGDETVLVVQEFGSTNETAEIAQAAPTVTVEPTTSVLTTNVPKPTQAVNTIVAITIQPSQSEANNSSVATSVAGFSSMPLIDRKSLSKNIALVLLSLFIFFFTLDMVIIERKKIVRAFTHHIDHVVFIAIMLLTILLMTQGLIL